MFTNRLNFTRTLHGRFLLALVLIGIIPVGMIGLGISILNSRAISEQSSRELTGLARGLAGQLDVHMTGMSEDSRAIAALLGIVGTDPARQGPLLKELFHHHATFARLSTFDRSGRLLVSSHPGTPSSIAMRESFQTAAESGRQAWMVATTLSTGRSSLLIHTPIRDAKRQVVGVLGAVVDLEGLSAAISRVHVGGGGQAFVVDAAGRVLLHEDKAAVQKRLDYSWIGIPTGGRPAGPGTVRYDAAGESRIAGYAVIPNTGWTVVVERPEAEILIPAKRSLRLALTGLAISVTLALVAAAFFALKLTRPVRELAAAARAFAAGDPFAPLPSVTAKENELGVLVETFDAMRKEVEAREKRLRAAEKKVRDLVEFAPDAIIGVKEDGCIAVVNTQAERLFGYSRGEMLGQPVEALLPERFRETHVAHRLTYYSQPKARLMGSGGNLYGRRKDGSEFHVQISLSPMETEEGLLVTSIIRDVTDSKEKEQQIRRSLDQIRALREIDRAITSTLDLRTILDVLLKKIDLVLPYAATTVRLFNEERGLLEPVACRNVDGKEWKAEQWRGGRGIPNVVFETKAPVIISNVQSDPQNRDQEFFRKHGLVSYLGVPLIVQDEVLGVISFYTKEEHDFSNEEVEFLATLAGQAAIAIYNSQLYQEMIKLAADLSRANKVKDEFLSVMSHELRTPLNVVMGYTGMIKDRLLGEINPEQEKALEKVISQTRDQLTMISSILQATQLEAEGVKVESQEFSLGDFLGDLRSSYEGSFGKELTLIWDYPSDLPVVKTDSEKLKHVLQNLISNAIKFTDNGTVTLSVRCLNGAVTGADGRQLAEGVEFKVTDTGIGIAEEFLPIIFERFRQIDSSETRNHGGVGIGLYIVKKFTELLGGKVEVESEPGKGSVFTAILPLLSAH